MTYTCANHTTAPRRRPALTAATRLVSVWRQRQALRRLDDARLADLGLTRSQAAVEAKRPIWDAPETWLR
ncbi:DUF1127 domain-containing protein [Primorskyibacter sp. S87]|uniref:DUF1127 domain-containing protein n=1 Tax=Primorskyibacter sp. S87 TaxID=3415126 RepID=UPI003C7A7BEA